VKLNFYHNNIGNLFAELVSPAGTKVSLFKQPKSRIGKDMAPGDTVRIRYGFHANRVGEVIRIEGRFAVIRTGTGVVTINVAHVEVA